MKYSITQVEKIVHGKLLLADNSEAIVEQLLLDSRKLVFPSTTLFFALGGPRRSGNSFINELFEKGVRNFVVDETIAPGFETALPGSNVLQVKNVQQALQALAAYHRSQFNIPVIGITGSNGKTIVKEWLFRLLQEDYQVVRSPRSYNSQTGVPLSVWQMNASHTLAIFEAGISQPGEMPLLEKIIRPTIGVFTNIGDAHSEGFISTRQKVNEKLSLFVHSKALVYGAGNPDVNSGVDTFSNNVRQGSGLELFSWSSKEMATLQIVRIEKNDAVAVITAIDHRVTDQPCPVSITIPFTDDASIQNAITCWCVLLYLQVPASVIAERMLQLQHIEMRLELKQGINNCSVINDSYSADINSLIIALDFLQQQQQHPNRTVILSDILQSGKSGAALYEEIALVLQQKNINRFIGIGPEIFRHHQCFSNMEQRFFFSSMAEFKAQFYNLHFYNETILLKGARVFEFEQISHLLEEKVHQTVLEINLNAVTHNLNAYQQLLKPGVKLMAMVKAFSYGSGGFEVANLLQFHKVDYLAVAYADEGVELRRAGITLPILVLNPEAATFDVMVQHNLEPELYSFGILSSFRQYLERSGSTLYPVHIKLDTGMHRLGFETQDLPGLTAALKDTNVFKIQSVFSHLAASDAAEHDAFTNQQATQFLHGCETLQTALGYSFIRHISNSSSIHRHPHLQLDMVRLGIGLYGVDGNPVVQAMLNNVSTLKTTISQVKAVAAGESVGYSRKGIVKQDAVIATVRIGYADGYPRSLSNGVGKMLVNGHLVPVIGNICMDMTMLDITGTTVQEGDEVIVFGEQLPVSELATWASTIPYEILTGVSQRVKRVYFEE